MLFFVITEDHLFFYTSVTVTGLTDVLAKFSMSHKQISYFLFLTIMYCCSLPLNFYCGSVGNRRIKQVCEHCIGDGGSSLMEAVSLFTCHVGNLPNLAWSAIQMINRFSRWGLGPSVPFLSVICFLFSSEGVTISPLSLFPIFPLVLNKSIILQGWRKI